MPTIVKLYFVWKMPALRDVANLLADVVDVAVALGALAQEDRRHLGAVIDAEVIVIGTMSSEIPYDSTRSRSLVSDSTDHFSSIARDGRLLQMLLQPKAAIAFRMASESPCWVPTLNFTFAFDVPAAGARAFSPPARRRVSRRSRPPPSRFPPVGRIRGDPWSLLQKRELPFS